MVGTHPDVDTVLDLCQDHHRRIVLGTLADREQVTVNDLANAIVKHDHHVPPAEVSDETAHRIRIALHHVHLPKLSKSGVVEYDPERKLVKPTARFDRMEPHLSAILDADSEFAVPPDV